MEEKIGNILSFIILIGYLAWGIRMGLRWGFDGFGDVVGYVIALLIGFAFAAVGIAGAQSCGKEGKWFPW